MRKNVASQNTCAELVSKTDGTNVTSGTTNVFVMGDGGTQNAGAGTVTHKGNGCWLYAPTQAETNFNHVAFTFTNSTAVSVTVQVYTVGYDPQDTVRLGLSALPNAAAAASGGVATVDANNAVKVQSGTGANQINLVSGNVGLQSAAIARANFAVDTGLQSVRSNTAQAGAAGTITLDSGASSVTDFYVGAWIYITSGPGAGQTRICTAYNGGTFVATIAPNWATQPNATSTFAILTAAQVLGVVNTLPDSSGVTTLLGRLTSGRATNLDNLSGDAYVRLGAPAGASVSADIAAVKSDSGGLRTDYTTGRAAKIDFLSGDAFARLGAPAGANVSADIAAVKSDTGGVRTDYTTGRAAKIDFLTGDAFVRLGAPAGASVSADVASIKSDSSGLRADYTTARAAKLDNADTTVSSRATPAQVYTQIVQAIATDTYGEPSAIPGASVSLKDKLAFLAALARNKITQTATTQTLRNDGDTLSIGTATHSDDGTTHTKGKWS